MLTLPLQKPPQSLCILRLSAIGDICHTLPVVRRLQDNWPDTELTWLIGKVEHSLIGDIPGINFRVIDKQDMSTASRSLSQDMRGQQFDVLLHMQAALRSSLLARRIPATLRLGFDRKRAREFQWLFSTHQIQARPRQHVMHALMGFADALGAANTALRWDIPIPDSAADFAQGIAGDDENYLVVVPCSSPTRNYFRDWCAERNAEAVIHAAKRWGLRTVICGGNSDQEKKAAAAICESITHAQSIPAINLVGKTSLKELLAVLKNARMLIAPDTGPLHMAGTVATPVIGLFASTNPDRSGPVEPRWSVNEYPAALLAENGKKLAQARWGEKIRDPQVMLRITTKAVCDQVDQIMQASGQA